MIGGALELDGVDDSVLVDLLLDPRAGSFSILTWVKGGTLGQVIVSQADAKLGRTTSPGCSWLAIDAAGMLTTDLAGADPAVPETEVVLADGRWHRVGLVWDDFSKTSTLYIDSVEVAACVEPILPVTHGGLQIGVGRKSEPGTFFSGLIDDVRIYDRAVKP
jgi:hypothetical protein